MKSSLKSSLTESEKKKIYKIGKRYYLNNGNGPNEEEWNFLTKIPYHQKIEKQFQIVGNDSILGYTISTKPSKINGELWSKVMEGGISNSSTKKLKNFILMFDFLKKQDTNLLIEVGLTEQKMYSILTKHCKFKPFQYFEKQKVTQIMAHLLNHNNFEFSKNENLIIKRQTRQIKNYSGNMIYWSP